MEKIKDNKINYYPESISLEATEEIIEQMKKKVCKISLKDSTKGTGFFCKIPYPNDDNLLPVLITNNNIINESIIKKENEKISLSINNDREYREIILDNRIKYTNKKYDITIIEIKENDKIYNYLELERDIKNKSKKIYNENSIYILHYPRCQDIYVSYGIIEGGDKYNFKYLCCTEKGSLGSPILNVSNNKLIGIHKGVNKEDNYNRGLFLKYAIYEFNNHFNNNNKNEFDFNKSFYLEIKDIEIVKLDLSNKWIGNEGIKYLCENLNFKELKELNLSYNISDIKILENVKFEKLEKLDLSSNELSNDINILENMNFKELKELNLCYNNISDISILEKIKLEKLEKLHLGGNKIDKNKYSSIIKNLKPRFKLYI